MTVCPPAVRHDLAVAAARHAAVLELRLAWPGTRPCLRSSSGDDAELRLTELAATGSILWGHLRYVIERIADHPVNRVDELLSWNVASAIVESNNCSEVAAHRPVG